MANPLRDVAKAAAPLRPVRLGALDAVLERSADGTIHIRSAQVLAPYHSKLSEPLEHWAKAAPERVFLEPIQEEWIHEQGLGLVKRLSMRRIMARRMKAATVRA